MGRKTAAIAGALSALWASSASGGGQGAQVTIYRSSGEWRENHPYGGAGAYGGAGYGGIWGLTTDQFAVIVEEREIELAPGENQIAFAGVPETLEPATVQFRSATDPAGTSVVEQKFAYDLASPDALLGRYLHREITALTAAGEITGKLISYDAAQLVLETADARHPIRVIPRGTHLGDLRLGKLPEGLVTSPTLRWKVRARRAGRHRAEVSYRSGGFAWAADYAAVYHPGAGTVDLRGWVSLRNASGVAFENARVVLVSGRFEGGPQQVNPYGYQPVQRPAEPKSFALPRAATLLDRDIVQLELFEPIHAARAQRTVVYEALPVTPPYYASGYPNTDCYAYQYQASRTHGDRYLEVAIPGREKRELPEGRARVFRQGSGGTLELIGEDLLSAGADGTVRLKVGSTGEVSGERRQLDCRPDDRARTMHEKIELTIKNGGDSPVDVIVREHMQRWPNWVLESESEKGTRVGQAQEWRVRLQRGGARTITYAVLYSW